MNERKREVSPQKVPSLVKLRHIYGRIRENTVFRIRPKNWPCIYEKIRHINGRLR